MPRVCGEEAVEEGFEGHEEADAGGGGGEVEVEAVEGGGEECGGDEEEAAAAGSEGFGAGDGEDEDGGEEDVAIECGVLEEGEEFAGEGFHDLPEWGESDVENCGGPEEEEEDCEEVGGEEEEDGAWAEDVAVGEIESAEEDGGEGDGANASGDDAEDEEFDGGELLWRGHRRGGGWWREGRVWRWWRGFGIGGMRRVGRGPGRR